LLTSGGITNDRIKTALADLAGKDIKDISVADIITASAPVNDSIYAVAEKESLKQAGLENVSVIDIRDPRENWINTLESADVIWIEGGNTYYLLDWARKSGLDKDLPELLKDKVYVGVSAGSILVGPDINYAGWDIGDKDKNETDLVDFTGLNIVDFGVFPHYKEDQKNDLEKMSKTINYPMYAIDDGCAILVRGGQVKAIGEGVGLIMENRKNKSVKLP
jgi:dipeptidase E